MTPLTENERLHFRDQLRTSRASALNDAEGSHATIVAVEQLGARLCGTTKAGLAGYEKDLTEFVATNGDTSEFAALFGVVRTGRNAAIHGGAYARHLAARSAELALHLETKLMNGLGRIKHYMVRDPVCAQA